MAYDKGEILEQALVAIKEHKLTFFDEITLYVAPALSTLYEWKLEESDDIKNALRTNRISRKTKMRKKWEDSENAVLQLAAYKLIAEKEEIERLTMSKVSSEQSGPNGGPIQTETKHVVEFHDFTGKGNTTEV
jgi:hypothetical protein